MGLYLYGVIEHEKTTDFGPIGFGGGSVRAIPHNRLAAIVGQPPAEIFSRLGKELLIAFLLAHQKTLEQVMREDFVLPFKFGTTVKDEAEVTRILEEGKGLLTGLMGRMKDHTEIDVVATWDVTKTLREISEEDTEVLALKKEMAEGKGDPVLVGMCLAEALKRRALIWRQKIKEGLKGHSVACADHDLLNDTMVLNSSFLIHRNQEMEFNQALEGADKEFQNKLHLKCVGPLPPYSFATVTIKRFDPEEVQKSAKTLGLNGKVELTLVKKIYKELSKQCHPDMDPKLSARKFEELSHAYETIADYCEDGLKLLEKAAIEKCVRLKVAENLSGVNYAT